MRHGEVVASKPLSAIVRSKPLLRSIKRLKRFFCLPVQRFESFHSQISYQLYLLGKPRASALGRLNKELLKVRYLLSSLSFLIFDREIIRYFNVRTLLPCLMTLGVLLTSFSINSTKSDVDQISRVVS